MVGNSFTQVFGGNTIYPSDVSYLALALTTDVVLSWPLDTATSADVVARIMDVSAALGGLSVYMPPAFDASVGQTVLFNNIGSATITVRDADGATLVSLGSGEQWELYLIDNSTSAGLWRTYRFGAATSVAQASALAGYGLTATGATLSQNYETVSFNSNYTLGLSDRAKLFSWTGGAGALTLPTAATAGNGWFVNVRNSGTGALTLTPSGTDIIDDLPTLVLQPGDSAIVTSSGLTWNTVGLGQAAVFAFDYTSISVTGGTYTLAGAELNRIAYKFVGTLTSNAVIVVPNTVQQYWVDNATTGSYTLSVKTASQPVGVAVAQGSRTILYSDGSNVVTADTAGLATPISIADGGTGATTANGALINLGGTSVGIAVFTATDQAAAQAAIGVSGGGSSTDAIIFAVALG